MGTSRGMIKDWLLRGKKNNCSHVIVVCDTFDYEDYPVFVKQGDDVRKVFNAHSGINMQRVMEVYNLSLDIEKQLNEHRAMNF